MLTYPICHFSVPPIPVFVFLIDTRNTTFGSSASNQMMLPLESSGTYNFNINWGDSSNNDGITTWNQAETTHTYAASGIYTVTITGQCHGWRFNSSGDRLKILDVISTGNTGDSNGFRLGNNNGYFRDCINLTWSATDPIDLTGTSDLNHCFRGCTNFNGAIGNWDVSSVTSTNNMFRDALLFNQDISALNVSAVTTTNSMFRNAPLFNQDISAWNVSSVTNTNNMFRDANSFDQNLSLWNVSSITSMNNMFRGITLSTTNYSAMLIAWNMLSLQNNVLFHAGSSQYSAGAAATARANIIAVNTWTITDGGQV